MKRQKKYGPNERTDQTTKIELSNEEIANIPDAEFKTLVIRMLTEMVEYVCKMEKKVKKVKAMQSVEKFTRNQQRREENWDSNQ